MIASSAVNRIGTPEDIADLVSYLASDGASFVTGTCASVFLHRARLFTLLRHSHTIYKGQSVRSIYLPLVLVAYHHSPPTS
jgi:hypothetical protein